MVKSMTGYGRAEQSLNGRTITVELRSVNNRYLDCSIRIPRLYLFAEDGLKSQVQSSISRGKVDVFVTIDSAGAAGVKVSINRPVADGYCAALRELAQSYGLSDDISVSLLSRFPDVLLVEKEEEDAEQVAQDISAVMEQALSDFDRMRSREGQKLSDDILTRADTIERLVTLVEERSPQTVEEYRARLEAKMNEVLANTQLDPARILTEAAIFADKVAVDEETVRLRSHLGQLRHMLAQGGATGRKWWISRLKSRRSGSRSRTSNEGAGHLKLINIGFGNMISAGRLVAIVSPDSAPIKRMVQEARDRGTLIDATYGRRTRSVLIMDNDHLVLSALQPDTVASRLESREAPEAEEDEE